MKGKLTVLMITAFVDMLGLAMIIPLLPFYATKLGASATVVGILIAAFSIAQLASAPLWGRFSDRYGRRPALLVGLLVSAAAYVIFAYASTLWLLLLSRVVQGLGGGTIGVVQAYVADASDPKDRAKSLGWLSAATSFGAVVGPAIGSALIHWGRHAPGIASAIFCVLVSIFAGVYLRESREDSLASGEHGILAETGSGAIWSVIARPKEPAQRLIWIYAIAIGAFYGTAPTLPLILAHRLPITEGNVGFFVMYLGGMGVFVRAGLLGRMIEWLGEARLTRLGLVLLAAGLALIAAVHSYLTLLVSLTLMPLGTAFVFPCVTAMLSRVVPARNRGLYMGVQHTFGGVSRVVFPLAAGVAMDHLGLGFPFVTAGVLVLATLLLTTSMEDYAASRAPFDDVKSRVRDRVGDMPTPAERKALLFLSTVLVLGASTRAYRTLHSRSPANAQARSALERQIKAADSARRSGLRRPKREKRQKTPPKPAGPVDLDVATEKEIEALRHVGPTLARRIVADRDSFGPFGSMEGLRRVKGIGPSMVAKLDSAVTFSLLPRPTNRVISRPSELPKARRKPHRRDMRP